MAIGRNGQNVRLASELTGWKINLIDLNTGKTAEEVENTTEEVATEETTDVEEKS